jgi:hypothetical protein
MPPIAREDEQQAPATEEKESTIKVVDETGKGVAGVPMVFRGAETSKTVPTDSSGVVPELRTRTGLAGP